MGFFMWSMLGLVMGSMFGSVMESFLDITLITCMKGHKSERSHTLCLNYKVSASQSASTQDTSMDPPEREKSFPWDIAGEPYFSHQTVPTVKRVEHSL